MVAFHFQFANQAGWKCDICRRSGLEQKRQCGWAKRREDSHAPVVWARKQVALTTCPKSYITAESAALLEEFFTRRQLGAMQLAGLSGRQVDAFLTLEGELAAERRDAQQHTADAF